jgi:uncharacterized protein (TIGR02145 family)
MSARTHARSIRIGAASFGLYVAVAASVYSSPVRSATHEASVADGVASKRMADGKQWTTENLAVAIEQSYCYDDAEANCRKYGRLYTWSAAQQGCRALGEGWRLPTNEEWRDLANQYGGLLNEADDKGKAAFAALMIGGRSGFNAVLSGGRNDQDHQYLRLEAHGFYWTATESGAGTAWFYNFGRGGGALNRHSDGEKLRALAVRCIRD